MVIRAGDRVSAVIARDERLIEVFASLSPAFERLRNPAMRKVMARLVTVEQAARMAGVDPEELVARLNASVGGDRGEPGGRPEAGEGPAAGRLGAGWSGAGSSEAGSPEARRPEAERPTAGERPEAAGGAKVVAAEGRAGEDGGPANLRGFPPELVVDLDVRDDLRQGREPFSRIMAAKRSLPEGGVLRLRAIFEPVPLYAVMARQGFEHWTEKLGEDDWRVWFYPAGAGEAAGAGAGTAGVGASAGGAGADVAETAAPGAGSRGGAPEPGPTAGSARGPDPEDDVVILDVRGLEPPEPMMRTLEAAERLPAGGTLVQINVRVPQFLLPQLEARGFTYEVREQGPDLVRVFIRRRADG